jgi:hypothetical protein
LGLLGNVRARFAFYTAALEDGDTMDFYDTFNVATLQLLHVSAVGQHWAFAPPSMPQLASADIDGPCVFVLLKACGCA